MPICLSLHSGTKSSDQVFEQLPEVDASVRREVEYNLAAVEKEFHIDQVHGEPVGGNAFEAIPPGIQLYFNVAEMLADLFFRSQPFDRFYLLRKKTRILGMRRFDHLSQTDPLLGMDDYVIVLPGRNLPGVKVVNLASLSKANPNHLFHKANP